MTNTAVNTLQGEQLIPIAGSADNFGGVAIPLRTVSFPLSWKNNLAISYNRRTRLKNVNGYWKSASDGTVLSAQQ